ncbi:MFS transporter [Brevundimonas sp.]|uniref:MFS transporter n=1 Tax=Brevundimonas sp. TaxID=1871086 RepID=UPI001A1E0708|nr:MFS transporter [Brevundimonas sp.]MBJ7483304.1 MFS transporter [Brevundimonas sp.]
MTAPSAAANPAATPAGGRKLPGLLSLSLMGIPLTALSLPLVVMIPEHYATVLGLPLAVIGLIFTGVRIFDIVVDPLIGAAMDRTRSRWGRYRPWLIFGAPALMLAVYLLFMAKPGVGPIYLLLTLTAAFLGWSVLSLAQLALASGLAASYDGRSRVYAWLQFASLLGILTVMGFPILLKSLGDTGMAPTQIMGWIIIVLMAPAVALAAWRVPEAAASAQRHIVGIKEYLAVVGRKAVFRIAAIDLLFGLGFGTASAMLVFFVTAAKGLDRSAIGVVLIAQVVTAMITVPAVAWLARRLDKHFVLGITGLLAAIVSVAFVFLPDGNLVAVSLGMMGWGLSFGAFNLLPRAMMADAGDELRLDTGSDQTGVLYALLISSWKLGGALAVGLSFAALAMVGYKPALMTANTPEAISGLEMVFAGPSAVLFLLGAWLSFTYPLTREKHAAIRTALDARDAQAETTA